MSGNKIFQAPATLTRLSFTGDGGLNLGFVTQELTAEEKLTAARFHRTFGYVLFKESQFQDSEVPEDDPVEEGQKTTGQRLRAVLFVLYKQTAGHTEVVFEDFYKQKMEWFIRQVKRELED